MPWTEDSTRFAGGSKIGERANNQSILAEREGFYLALRVTA